MGVNMKIGVILGSVRGIRRGGREAVHITYVLDTISEDGRLLKGHFNERAENLVNDLLWWAHALKKAKTKPAK